MSAERRIPLQPLAEMVEHWVGLGLLDPVWLAFVQRAECVDATKASR